MKEKLRRFFQGRSGPDQFSRFLIWVSLGLMLLSLCLRSASATASALISYAAFAVLAYGYFRLLSKNIYRRRKENARYLARSAKVRSFFANKRRQFRDRKDYRYFTCPACGATLRVPRGKGKLQITCAKCAHKFQRTT